MHQPLCSGYCVKNGMFVFEWLEAKDINKLDLSESSRQNIFPTDWYRLSTKSQLCKPPPHSLSMMCPDHSYVCLCVCLCDIVCFQSMSLIL